MLVTLIVVVALFMLIAGVRLLRAGLRGRVVPGVVECAGCRFDLTGLFPAARCPECGRDLAPPRASRQRRVRSRPRIAAGSALVGLPLVAGATIAVIGLRNVSAWQNMPNWMLRQALLHSTAEHAASAVDELAVRMGMGNLSAAQGRAIVADLNQRLEGEGGPPPGWTVAHSEYFQRARMRGWVSDEEWVHFAERMIRVVVTTRGRVRSGVSLPFRVEVRSPLLAKESWLTTGDSTEHVRIRLFEGPARANGHEVQKDPWVANGKAAALQKFLSWDTRFIRLNDPPGMAEIEIEHEIQIVTNCSLTHVLSSRVQRDKFKIEIVDPGTPAVEINSDPSVQAQLQKVVTLREANKYPSKHVDATNYHVRLRADKPACNLAFNVIVRPTDSKSPDDERVIGKALFLAGQSKGWAKRGTFKDFHHRRIDVVLRSSVEVAEESPWFTTVWVGPDIVFEDVEVE